MMISKLVKLSCHLICIREAVDLGRYYKLIMWFVAKTGLMTHQWKFWLLLCNACTSRVCLSPHSASVNRLGRARGCEGTQLGQLSQSGQRDALCHVTSWPLIKPGVEEGDCGAEGMGVCFQEGYCSENGWALVCLWEEMTKYFYITCGFFWPTYVLLLSFFLDSKVFVLLLLLFSPLSTGR